MLADGLMKKAIREYFTLSRTERTGALVLLVIVLGLVGVNATMRYWVKPDVDVAKEKELNAVWEKFQAEHGHPDEAGGWAKADEGPAPPVELFPFDPNTLDSAGFRKLGLTARATKGLMNWRRKGKVFYKPEDLEPLYNLPAETYAAIKPYIRISATRRNYEARYGRGAYGGWNHEPLPDFIDLNTADAALLVRLNGIGQTLADKIVARRAALGGFLKHEQLLEVYKFPDTTFTMLKEKLRINAVSVRKLNINTATEAQFANHPYIGEKLAPNIILLRNGFGTFSSVEQLKQVPLMTAEMFRKIAPYCTVQ